MFIFRNKLADTLFAKIELLCISNSDKTLKLEVSVIPNVEYRWQYCKSGTAEWKNDDFFNGYLYQIIEPFEGDKYRCIILEKE